MALLLVLFTLSLGGLLISAKFFTNAAEKIGTYLRLSPFVIGVFIIGIGTSLPELISGILSVRQGVSEIVPGNIVGANIANLLLLVGLTAVLNRKPIQLQSTYIYIDLHFLIGGVSPSTSFRQTERSVRPKRHSVVRCFLSTRSI